MSRQGLLLFGGTYHGMAYDPIRDRVVLFGADGNSQSSDDTWEWDGASWTQLTPPSSQPPRSIPSVAA